MWAFGCVRAVCMATTERAGALGDPTLLAWNVCSCGHSQALPYILYSGHQLCLRYLQRSALGR